MNKVGRSNPVGAGSVRKSRGEVVESKRLNGSMAHKEVKNGIEEQKLSANDNDDDIIEHYLMNSFDQSAMRKIADDDAMPLDVETELRKYNQRETDYLMRVDDCLTKDPSLREDQVKLILQSFSVLDENGDGRISKTEIARAYRLAGFNPTKTELEQIVKEHDANDDGYIDFEEYFNVMRSKMIKVDFEKDRMKTAFKVLDVNNDGFISVEELRNALSRTGDHFTDREIDEILRLADKNNDGRIDYNEFVDADLCKSVF
ncbi:uncharacterized protein LOC127848272 [Dreissena polymorpha]|nr:uncharacterized protein LOC127848272 [Dreissena polymorpha]